MSVSKRTIAAIAKNLAIAEREADTIIEIIDGGENFEVRHGSGKWKVIAIIGKTEFGMAIIAEICYNDQRPYNGVHSKKGERRLICNRKKIFKLANFCDLEKIIPIICSEMQKIVDKKTDGRKYRCFSPTRSIQTIRVLGPKKGVSRRGRIEKRIERGIFFQ
jgi:hypothetical protein